MPRRMLKFCLFFTCVTILLLALTGCACKHETTNIVNEVAATCTSDGYSGDAVCTECDEVLATGETIPATGHTDGELRDAADATCTADGYSGDIYCDVCGEISVPGEVIPMTGHTPAEEVVNAAEPTCVDEGYTGDILCTVCDEVLTAGEAIPAAGHVEGEVTGAVEATCETEGYTGDIPCTVCGEILTAGEAIPAAGHTEGEVTGVVEPGCVEAGYSGDVYCTVCEAQLVTGEELPAAGHVPAEPANAAEATCSADGYTGDILCSVCGELITAGEAIPATGEHAYTDNVCACGWMEPGLYADGAMVKTWDELKAEGIVTVEDGILVSVQGDLGMGLLVIGEDVTYIDGREYVGFNCDTLSAVWVPGTVTELGRYLLSGNAAVTEVKLFCPITGLSDYAFSRSKGLTTITLPATLETIGPKAFNGCNITTVYYGGDAAAWEAIGGAAALPEAEVITE